MDKALLQRLLKDNPAGNGHEMTPFVLLREKKAERHRKRPPQTGAALLFVFAPHQGTGLP